MYDIYYNDPITTKEFHFNVGWKSNCILCYLLIVSQLSSSYNERVWQIIEIIYAHKFKMPVCFEWPIFYITIKEPLC